MGTGVTKREADVLIKTLSAGVVPRIGLRHIAVGRKKEIDALLSDLESVEAGYAAFRFICGQYGSGKSFLLQVIRNNAMERNFVVADADLSPERRLTGKGGYGLATYRELMANLAILAKPEGGALESILQRCIASLQQRVMEREGFKLEDRELMVAVESEIKLITEKLTELPYGFSFASVLNAYWMGFKSGNSELRQSALKWLRGEYTSKTEARQQLHVDRIIEDDTWYDFLKLFSLFVKEIGFKGLLVFIDEGVNLYKIPNRQAREKNYEKILTIFNDTMQGKARYIGFFLTGTVKFIYDERRGLFSYEALQSRLSDNQFHFSRHSDFTSPIIKLEQLTPEEIFVLLERLCEVHEVCYSYKTKIGDKEIKEFMESIVSRLGADKLLTPREIIRDFLSLLNEMKDNPEYSFESLLHDDKFAVKSAESDPEDIVLENDNQFTDFDI